MSSVLAEVLLLFLCYQIRGNMRHMLNIAILITIDNTSNENLDSCLDESTYNVDINYESFSLVLLNNALLYEGSTIIDCSLTVGNQIDTLLSGFIVVFTFYYNVGRYVYFIF